MISKYYKKQLIIALYWITLFHKTLPIDLLTIFLSKNKWMFFFLSLFIGLEKIYFDTVNCYQIIHFRWFFFEFDWQQYKIERQDTCFFENISHIQMIWKCQKRKKMFYEWDDISHNTNGWFSILITISFYLLVNYNILIVIEFY